MNLHGLARHGLNDSSKLAVVLGLLLQHLLVMLYAWA